MLRFAVGGARAHRVGHTGTLIVLAFAGALLSVTGVLLESGLRAGAGSSGASVDGAMLATVAASFGGTATVVVGLVVASTVALALRQRRREFALLRAVGATRRQVRRLVGIELMLVAAVATPPGAVMGLLAARRLTPLLVQGGIVSSGFRPALSPAPVVSAVVVLVPVALVAAAFATRETLRTPPTEAVRESVVESPTVGRARRLSALVLAVGGLATATTPAFVPGTTASATAATSAFLLIGSAAAAGPLLVGWSLDRPVVHRLVRGVSGRLAVAYARSFSTRLTMVIVPLVLVLATGTVQSSTDEALAAAARAQLRAGLHADVVVTQPGLTARLPATVARTPGVVAAVPVSTIPAEVRTDDDDTPGLEALSWDPTSLRVVPAGDGAMYDLGTGHGTLAALRRPDTIAASVDALIGTGIGVGDRVSVRLGGVETSMTVVATYDRGLGFGDYFTGRATLLRHGLHRSADTVLVRTGPAASAGVIAALRRAGLTAMDKDAYVAATATADAGPQHLSLVLLLGLLGFIALAAANSLVMSTASRRAELTLLRRTGATPRQLLAVAAWEAGVAAGIAWAIGTIAVIPAVIGVDVGLLGPTMPRIDLTVYAGLSGLMVLITLAATVPTVAWQLRGPTGSLLPRRLGSCP